MDISVFEAIKTETIAALRTGDVEAFNLALQKYDQHPSESEEELIFNLDAIGVAACLAMKAELESCARNALETLYTSVLNRELSKTEEESFWTNMRYIACMAARTHTKELFTVVVSKLAVLYADRKNFEGSYEKFSELLKVLLFIAVDRKYTEVIPMLQWLGLRFAAEADEEYVADFLREWACMAAQTTRRGWEEVSKPLLSGLLRFLLKQRSFKLTRKLLLCIAMHMQMLAAWDGAERVLRYYEPVQTFSLIVLKRALKEKDEGKRIRWARLVLRWWRDFIAAAARHTLSDETEVYQLWHKFAQENLSAKRFLRVSLLQQLTISYWSLTQPRTTNRRVNALGNITENYLIDEDLQNLLQMLK